MGYRAKKRTGRGTMSNRPKAQRATDESIAEADRLYNAARADADEEIKKLKEKLSLSPWIFEMAGKIKSMVFTESQAKFLKILFLKRVKERKEYREVYGLDWVSFCAEVGINYKTADRWLEEFDPLPLEFSDKLSEISGCDLNKIKHLSRSISDKVSEITEEGVTICGEMIPWGREHKEEFTALLEKLEETYKKQIEEKTAQLRTKERLLESKDQLIHRQEKTISKYERNAGDKGLTLEEDAFLQKVENLRIGFDGYMLSLDPDRVEEVRRENNPTSRMIAAYIAAIEYMKMQICAARDTAVDYYADPSLLPDEGWQPPEEARKPPSEPFFRRERPSYARETTGPVAPTEKPDIPKS